MAAKLISVVQAKGGVGKSTLCANLATTFADSLRTLVIDCDPPQNSMLAWHGVRSSIYEETGLTVIAASKPAELLNVIKANKDDFDIIIADGPPHINTMTRALIAISSLVLVPLAPSPVEIWSFQTMDALIQEGVQINKTLQARVCWTRVRKRVLSAVDLMKEVKKGSQIQSFNCQLTQRVAYVDSFAQGLTVYEWNDTVARAEIWSLYSMVQRLLKKASECYVDHRKDILQFSKI